MDDIWMLLPELKVKKCHKCKSKKLKKITISDNTKDQGHTLIRNIPGIKCKSCGQVHTGVHHLLMNQVLQDWFKEGDGPSPGEAIM
jgi:YgiT-type zinc finger domain-containing protein